MQITYAGLSSMGPVRTNNEDNLEFWQPNTPEEWRNRGAVVILADEKYVQKAKTTTKPDGTFAFKDLLPATYFLFSEKEATGRQAKVEIAVKPGETANATLELLLK